MFLMAHILKLPHVDCHLGFQPKNKPRHFVNDNPSAFKPSLLSNGSVVSDKNN